MPHGELQSRGRPRVVVSRSSLLSGVVGVLTAAAAQVGPEELLCCRHVAPSRSRSCRAPGPVYASHRLRWSIALSKKFPISPKNPHRICWGCDKYCPSDSLACGNGSERTQHPAELFGEDWQRWELASPRDPASNEERGSSSG